jgi:transcriptional regulator with XRE-family HTH domain
LTTPRDAFGPRLRDARKRAGVTLDAIARSTKIRRSLLVELEKNDCSHWPPGIFRRAFFREYLAAIGIASESLVAEFVRLFPEDGVSSAATGLDNASELRLTLAEAPWAGQRVVITHVAAAIVDLCLVALLATLGAWLSGMEFWVAASVIALLYYSLGTACAGLTPATSWFSGTRQMPLRTSVHRWSTREQLRIVRKRPELPRLSPVSEATPEEGPDGRRAVSG